MNNYANHFYRERCAKVTQFGFSFDLPISKISLRKTTKLQLQFHGNIKSDIDLHKEPSFDPFAKPGVTSCKNA